MNWALLGIAATTDKDAITRAYRERLTQANPEERPEAFKELRAAYEEALRLADEAAAPETEKTPIDRWISQVEAAYDDLSQRIDPAIWEDLMHADVVCALDTRPEAEAALLRCLMDRYFLPQAIWKLLDGHFAWTERADELRETFDPDFITYAVIGGVASSERLPLKLFTPGRDGASADRYIRLYNKVTNSTREEAAEALQALRESPEQHPYGQAFILRSDLEDGDETALEGLEALVEAYPEDDSLLTELAIVYLKAGRFDEAIALADRAIATDPKYTNRPKRVKAEALAGKEEYADAVEVINDLMGACDGNPKLLWELNQTRAEWNLALIAKYEAAIAENPDDLQTRFDLAWCYLQNNRPEDAAKLAEALPEEFPDSFGYHNLKAYAFMETGHLPEALIHEEALVEVVRAMKPDGTEKTAKRMARLAETIGRKADTLMRLGRTEEALAAEEEALAVAPDDPDTLTNVLRSFMGAERWARAEELADKLVALTPHSYHGFMLKAILHYREGHDGIAYDAINDAIAQDPTDLMEYQIKLLLLMRNDLYDQAADLMDYLEGEGVTDDLCVAWCRARLIAERDKKPEEGLAAIREVEPRLAAIPVEDRPFWAADFYWRLAQLMADVKDAKEDYSRGDLIATLDKGLECDPKNWDCLEYKGWLLKKDRRNDEAIAIFEGLAARPHRGVYPEKQLAELYYRDLSHRAPEALKYYEILIEDDPEDGDLDFYAGMCCYRMLRLEEALAHFEAEQRKDPDDVDGYYRAAYTLLMMGRLPEAAAAGRKAAEMSKGEEKDNSRFWTPLVCALRRMGRAEEAVAALRECRADNPGDTRFKTMFETFLNLGMYDRCEDIIKEWKRDKDGKKDAAGWAHAAVLLEIVRGKLGKARHDLTWQYGNFLHFPDSTDVEIILQTDAGKTGKAAELAKRALEDFERNNPDDPSTWMMGRCALALWADGQIEEARQLAEKALALIDQELAKYSSWRPLNLTRRAEMLSFLGRFDEAAEAIAEARRLPLCEGCDFCSCEDADLEVARLVAMRGDLDAAEAMCREFKTRWPGEEDFEYLMAIIRAKRKR